MKKYNRSEIFKKAWTLVKTFGLSISEGLRKAWKEAKNMEMTLEQKIAALEKAGFSRWTKGNLDRMYINAGQLGLVCEYYKTGNIHNAYFNNENISNCEARRMKAAKTFIDIKNGFQVYGDNYHLKEAAEKLMNSVLA